MLPDIGLNDDVPLRTIRSSVTTLDVETSFRAAYANAPDGVTFKKTRKRLVRQALETIQTYGLDTSKSSSQPAKWLVCLSGGKDSYALLSILLELKYLGAIQAELVACNLDQGQPGFPKETLPNYLDGLAVPYRIETEDTYSIVTDKLPETKTYCALCSRLRRGILYRVAREEGCDAIVLGHHLDDALQTFFMNLFHGGRLAAMPPKLVNDEGDVMVLRPLIRSEESDIEKFATGMNFPIIPCTLCGSQDGLQRDLMKLMLNEWEQKNPGRKAKMAHALSHARPSHLHDPTIFDFNGILPES
ncbi:MAG: tRNA 2-thiocytidine(32) synthetase TtcA [Hyphomonadaceae bacterium TMED5]|nr:tRNA 2-thiocytidine(32) synthetase TtcA [Ponticaulis sp.]MAI89941.1 tRNA 2-thiocytidine(32) synthetase TtcA [Ponticaulis sp.]OUX99610.1 MAG: tRNA 2-thiocytidine(32) synthetase TtcA [Hyphomonadaceae bacterium TMED5]|tara:strand:+ start:76732 stop:77637 length:906 start_codon:yes stop_codon:yes gene_type:complete